MKFIVAIVALLLFGSIAYYFYDYLQNRPIVDGACLMPSVYRGQPQQDIDLTVKRNELKFTTKSGSPDLPANVGSQVMLVAEYMSCKYEGRNPGLTEDQKMCYRAFILSTIRPEQLSTYEKCTQRSVFSRHSGKLGHLADHIARTPASKISLDLDEAARNFFTREIQAPNDELLVQRICEIDKEKIACSLEGSTVRIRVK